jgi:rhodanese-related sulfurtransferase
MPRSHAHDTAAHSRRTLGKRLRLGILIAFSAILLTVALALLLPGKVAAPSEAAVSPSPVAAEISVAEAYDRIRQGAFVLDVRSQAEWDEFHLKGSTLIPLEELSDRVAELPQDEEIVVVCRSGRRSRLAAATLMEAGFTNVVSMEGGLQDWRDAGYPVEE